MASNPYAPNSALTLSDIRPGIEVVVIRGGAFHHERLQIKSKPYLKRYKVANPDQPRGPLISVESLVVKARSLGAAVGTEISQVGDGASNFTRERFLADMGICSDPTHGWSGHYTVLAANYKPDDHT